MQIDKFMIERAVKIADLVSSGVVSRNEGRNRLEKETGMNSGSAQDYITVYLAMVEGKVYKRTISTAATKLYFDFIYMNSGRDALRKALEASIAHVEYYSSLGHGNLCSIAQLITNYEELLLCE